jgi:type II restriction/modification system DNA methylase subunit YeeA
LRVDDGTIIVRPNVFARRGSGSYYTPDELVSLIINRTIGPLIDERLRAFEREADRLARASHSIAARMQDLAKFDPASAILDLKICDPAMGSGHFLVSLVDYLADRILAAIAESESKEAVEWSDYVSPLGARILAIRSQIQKHAKEEKWVIEDGQLDDRHILRRMILKRVIHGVDKNPMAVELAKVALWLHTFTVGAPLSFLDHHLKCGDSLFGEWVRPAWQ